MSIYLPREKPRTRSSFSDCQSFAASWTLQLGLAVLVGDGSLEGAWSNLIWGNRLNSLCFWREICKSGSGRTIFSSSPVRRCEACRGWWIDWASFWLRNAGLHCGWRGWVATRWDLWKDMSRTYQRRSLSMSEGLFLSMPEVHHSQKPLKYR